ncbi:MAG: hypothetical protein IT328_18030 [Caldilineaceae bacterium]|nr:hypothetical protein [Caldilineaceae bacterium]
MVDLAATLPPLLGSLFLLLLLAWFSRQISLHIQFPFYHLTRSQNSATLAIFLFFLPGVLLHESAHWIMARLLGLKTGKFRVWPKRHGKHIGLGSVSVESRDVIRDSLVGVAPLLVGTVLVTLIGHMIFDTPLVISHLSQGQWWEAALAFRQELNRPSGLLWAYLLFTIANAMMPSASDREPIKPVLFYSVLAIVFYILLGMPLQGATALMQWLAPTLQNLSSALFFVILLDTITLGVLYLIRLLITR